MFEIFFANIKRFFKNLKVALKYRVRIIFRSILVLLGVWVLVFANYGFVDYFKLRAQEIVLKKELAILKCEEEQLLQVVRAISGPYIEVDLLEMQLRKVLAYSRVDEEIFFWR